MKQFALKAKAALLDTDLGFLQAVYRAIVINEDGSSLLGCELNSGCVFKGANYGV